MRKILKPSVIPAILWAFTLAILMLLPSDAFPESKLFSYDKLAHFGVFFILSCLVGWGFIAARNSHLLSIKDLLTIFLITFTYSSALELLQYFVPGRMTDLYDFIANSMGGLFGLVVFYIFTQRSLQN
mgnify:CR=1 FL=1